jgi:hypothetical protein
MMMKNDMLKIQDKTLRDESMPDTYVISNH